MIPASQVRMWTRREGRDAVSISRRLCGSKTLVYNDDKRLTSLTYGGVTDLYYYTYAGLRYRARLGGTYYRYLYNGERVLEDLNDSGTMQARYTTENDSYYGQWLHLYRPSGTLSRFPMYDNIGSTRGLLDASGTATDWYELDTFGRQVSSSGTTPNPYRFGGAWGYITDPSGFLQLGERHYWPEVGRFIQQDPIGDGRNWYAYAEGNPLTRVDPSGLDERESVWHNIGDWATWKCGLKAASDSGFWWASLKQFAISQIPILPENIAENYGVKQVTHGYARVYYHFTDKRFTAWGAESKLVPKLAKKVAPVLTIPLAFYDWMKALEDSSELLYGYW